MLYQWSEILHILFVIAFMASVFYLPRILVNLAEARGEAAVEQRLALMGQRLYRFGHVMFACVLLFGLLLWLGHLLWPTALPRVVNGGWLHVKLLLVALIFAYYIVSGRLLRRAASGGALASGRALRWFNEIPLLLLLGVLWLVVTKPF
jgi:protoporphyrinogen IX oxidase